MTRIGKEMKYVTYRLRHSGEVVARVFDPSVSHDEYLELNPISAGFFRVVCGPTGLTVRLSSQPSYSLRMGPKAGDEEIISKTHFDVEDDQDWYAPTEPEVKEPPLMQVALETYPRKYFKGFTRKELIHILTRAGYTSPTWAEYLDDTLQSAKPHSIGIFAKVYDFETSLAALRYLTD